MDTAQPKPELTASKVIKVNLTSQMVEAYEGDCLVFQFECMTGDKSHPTQVGMFTVMRKYRVYRSHAYFVQMNYSQFFTYDGNALHRYHGLLPLRTIRILRKKLGSWFGSHGCVRLAEDDARALFEWSPVGAVVQVF